MVPLETKPLICAECGADAPPAAEGWRGYLDDEDQLCFFCPACSQREFGPLPGERSSA